MKFKIPELSGVQNSVDEIELSDDALETAVGKILAQAGIGGYEPETIGAALAIVATEGVEAFADIGANIGIFSLVLKSVFGPDLTVDAFEPLPRLNELACTLASVNGLDISMHREALSNAAGSAKFYVSARSDSSNSLNADFRKAKDVIEVRLTTLDEFFASRRSQGWMLKIDTESTEVDVLEGGGAFIAAARPWIICEVLPGRGEERLQQIVDRHGYLAYHLDGSGLSEPSQIRGDATYSCRDWLFAPRPLHSGLRKAYADAQAALQRLAVGGVKE